MLSGVIGQGGRATLLATVMALFGSASMMAHGAAAEDEAHWRFIASPYTLHFSPDENHRPVYAIGLERQRPGTRLFGASYFSNSFGQPSAYLYFGDRYFGAFGTDPRMFTQWTGGLLYGYKEPYEDKVPLNYHGFSPGLVLSVGWQFDRQFSAQVNVLGFAGLMVQLSYDIR